MADIQTLVLESAMDDWVSDYEVQGDFQSELALDRRQAYRRMTEQLVDWIRCGALVAGDMLDGFQQWEGSAEDMAARFSVCASAFEELTRPGQICWFDTGPNASSMLHEADNQ